jgi:hypothetical protein
MTREIEAQEITPKPSINFTSSKNIVQEAWDNGRSSLFERVRCTHQVLGAKAILAAVQ